MCTDNSCPDYSVSFQRTTGAPHTTPGAVAVPDPESRGNVYRSLSVINDTDQDIQVSYMSLQGIAGSFIVPMSIKGFTRTLIGTKFDLNTVKVLSLATGVAAVGNITFNFGS